MTLAVVTEGMHPAEREQFVERIATWYSKPADEPHRDVRLPAPASAEYDEETWGTDADAQARQAAAMSLFGRG